MNKQAISFVLVALLLSSQVFAKQNRIVLKTPFEESDGKESATWSEAIDFYKKLDACSEQISMEIAGKTDGGYPLHVVYYAVDGDFNKAHWHRDGKVIILINNGIHAGEPDGVDASMMMMRDVANGYFIPGNVILAVIPVYNVGGFLNRGSYSRASQNGPASYGFRGNAQNLDLNRDFIKCDAAETRSLEKLFTLLDPDIFIDNHVSDGADYQHVMTLLPTQHDKLGGKTGEFMYKTFTPLIYKDMKTAGYDLVPYVNDFDNTPMNGWREFIEPPRFASGYAALFQTIAYVPETHMLKPFKERVLATYDLMRRMSWEAGENASKIKAVRAADRTELAVQKEFPLDWKVDTSRSDKVTFKGYMAGHKTSEVSGQPRLYYDRNKPFTKQVPFYDHFIASKTVTAPKAYIIPRAWTPVISRLKRNGVEMSKLLSDTTITVTAYHIDNYETGPKPYEKHYLHKNIQVTPSTVKMKLSKGDYLIKLNQPAKRYIIETLEPSAPDGFFAWNFFDGILQQKEYFSDYVFEDRAAEMLKEDANLKRLLDEKRLQDTAFAKNGAAQLDFVYRHSQYMEPGYMRYPVYRIEN
ncbi:hypothetical protein CJD36_013260 [Flavipsychrobacter stenotrophus]|uniref:Peptidase M14 carboxypeptidase A domain-containing protein n=1 Tax=Flavipsychrobacter stenotrophus TaxID=2077091 RepID=A0A2S7SVK2_9BACT|nr:hypothetical protein [Flavipsychrobacter stenotrophus]PQJ10933.1 hypothetical protein CJD36_013260 [Flavipsychrobacter stenotrophus]